MKKQLPAAIILGIIAVVAALALAATNAVTKGPIAERALAAIKQACETVMTAENYEEIAAPEGGAVKKLFAAKNGDAVVGYVAVAETSGYGGPIETTIGLTPEGKITAISVGGINFAETAGFGLKAKDAAFTDQFKDKQAPVALRKGSIDAIGGATVTSKAVVAGVNFGVEAIAEKVGITLAEPSAQVEEPAVESALEPGKNVGVAQGFQSEVKATVTIAEDGTVESVKFETGGETPSFGTRIPDDEAFGAQFIGKTPPFEIGNGIDALAGATVSSKAVVEAINNAEPVEAGEETVLAEADGATLILDENGRLAIVTESDTYTGAITLDVSFENGDMTINSFAAAAKKTSTAEVDGNTAKAIAKGFESNVSATVTIDEQGKIVELKVNTDNETEYMGEPVGHNQGFINQFIGQTGQLAFGDGLDAVAGATVTSNAALTAINDCLLGLGVAGDETAAAETEKTPEAVSTAEVNGNTAKAIAKGFASNVSATVTVDAEGQITELVLNTDGESEYFGMEVAGNKKFTEQFIGKTGTLAYGDGLDVVAGSTVTSNAILAAVNDCLLGLNMAEAAPAQEAVAEETAVNEITGTAKGYQSEVKAIITLAADGSIATLKLETAEETPGFGTHVALDKAIVEQFIGKTGPFELGEGIDALVGATVTSKAVVEAINNALAGGEASEAPAAANEITGTAKGYQSEVKAIITLAADGSIATLKLETAEETPGFGTHVALDKAIVEQFIGKTGPFELGEGIDALVGATVTSKAAVEAINNALAGGEASEAPAAANEIAGTAKGYQSEVKAIITLAADGSIATLKLETAEETPGFGTHVALDKAIVEQFIGKTGPFELGEGIDALVGATVTSKAVVEAINNALAAK